MLKASARPALSCDTSVSPLSSLRSHTGVPVKLLSPPLVSLMTQSSLVNSTERLPCASPNVKTSPSVSPLPHPPRHPPMPHSHTAFTFPFSYQALIVLSRHLMDTLTHDNSFPLFQPWMLILFVQFYDWVLRSKRKKKRQMKLLFVVS